MTPKDLLEAAKTFGLPIVFLGLVLWFLAVKVWPFLEERVRKAEEASTAMFSECQERWVELSREFVTTQEKERAVLEKLAMEISGMRQDVRDIRKNQ